MTNISISDENKLTKLDNWKYKDSNDRDMCYAGMYRNPNVQNGKIAIVVNGITSGTGAYYSKNQEPDPGNLDELGYEYLFILTSPLMHKTFLGLINNEQKAKIVTDVVDRAKKFSDEQDPNQKIDLVAISNGTIMTFEYMRYVQENGNETDKENMRKIGIAALVCPPKSPRQFAYHMIEYFLILNIKMIIYLIILSIKIVINFIVNLLLFLLEKLKICMLKENKKSKKSNRITKKTKGKKLLFIIRSILYKIRLIIYKLISALQIIILFLFGNKKIRYCLDGLQNRVKNKYDNSAFRDIDYSLIDFADNGINFCIVHEDHDCGITLRESLEHFINIADKNCLYFAISKRVNRWAQGHAQILIRGGNMSRIKQLLNGQMPDKDNFITFTRERTVVLYKELIDGHIDQFDYDGIRRLYSELEESKSESIALNMVIDPNY